MRIRNPYRGIPDDDIYDIETALAISSLTVSSVMWFKPYLAADFPEITTTKKYIFIWSTDHDAGDGGIWWGEGDELDCSDFVELGEIIDLYQAESPQLFRIPADEAGDSEVIYLYYHTDTTDPANASKQQTHLITTTGGLLHTATWTQQGTVLGISAGENHTGYFKNYKQGVSDYKGTHLINADLPQQYKFSIDTDGRSFTRGDIYQRLLHAPQDSQFKITSGTIIQDLYGFNWYLGNVAPTDFVGDTTFCVVKLDSDLQPIQYCKTLNDGVGVTITINKSYGDLEVYVEGEISYFYWNDGSGNIKTAKYNITNLASYEYTPPLPSAITPAADTIAYYDFIDNVEDAIGGQDGTPNDLCYASETKIGYAGFFNGVSNVGTNVVTTNHADFQQSNIGIEFYFKTDDAGSGLKGLVVKQLAFGVFANNGVLVMYSWGTPTGFKNTTFNLEDNNWHKINVEIQDGVTNGTTITVDGKLELTTTYGISAQTEKLVIGTGDDGSGTPSGQEVKGFIGKVRIYDLP